MTSTSPFQHKLFCEFMSQVNKRFSLVDSIACGFHTLRYCLPEVSAERKSEGEEASLVPSFCYSVYHHDLLESS